MDLIPTFLRAVAKALLVVGSVLVIPAIAVFALAGVIWFWAEEIEFKGRLKSRLYS